MMNETWRIFKNHIIIQKAKWVLELKNRITTSKTQHVRPIDKVWISKDCNWSRELSISLKVRLLHSFHAIHFKHNGVRIQTSNQCFPNQFLQPNNRSATIDDNTQWVPNILKTTLYKIHATSQWSNKWSIRFSTALTHATPANYKVSPLDEIIIGKNPTPSCCPNKGHLVRDLSTPNIPPGE